MLNQQSVAFDVQQLKIYPMTGSDQTGSPSPVYGAGVQLEGVSDIIFTPSVISALLKGDGGMIISKMGRTDMFSVSATYGRVGMDAIGVMIGGQITDVGAGALEYVEWVFSMPNLLPFFRMEFFTVGTDNGIGAIVVKLFKCSLKTATFLDPKTDAFGSPKIDVECIPLISTGVLGQMTMYDVGFTPTLD